MFRYLDKNLIQMCSCNFNNLIICQFIINYCTVFDFELSIYLIIYTHIMDEYIYFTIISVLKCLFCLKSSFVKVKNR